MDFLARFPRVWCPTCNKPQRIKFEVMKANDKNDPDAADIICDECKSIIATLHGPRAHRAGATRFQFPGRSPDWLKMKNADAPAVKCEAEEDWGR